MEPSTHLDDDERVRIQFPPDTPFDKKWDILKPVVKQLYIEENKRLTEVTEIVEAKYGFAAT